MSLKQRLILSYSIIIGLTLILGVTLIVSSVVLRARYRSYQNQRSLYDLTSDLYENYQSQRQSIDGYLLGVETDKTLYDDRENEIGKLIKQWRDLSEESGSKEEGDYENEIRDVGIEVKKIFRFLETDRKREALLSMEESVSPRIDKILKELKIFSDAKKKNSELLWSSAQRLANQLIKWCTVLLLIVVGAGVFFSIFIYRSISRPLQKLEKGITDIESGQWNLKLDIVGPDELAKLARKFEEMVKSLRELESKVVQMGRMSAVGTLAGGVAHEINNPLTGVLGQAQLLLEKIHPEDPIKSNVEKIERAALRCKKIVRGLLDFSRAQDYVFGPVDVDQVIQGALSLCETEVRHNKINIIWNKNPTLPKISASDHHLQQVFLNSITNSMHAMPKGGDLAIKTDLVNFSDNPGRRKEDSDVKNFVEVSFRDTGIGIEPKNLGHIFDPFFTTKEPGKGTGLGLSISYGIMQQHRGHIRVNSEGAGKGTIFSVYVPIQPQGEQLPLIK